MSNKIECYRYQLLDSGNGKKLEQVGPFRFCRPANQAVWWPALKPSEWSKADSVFERHSGGEGSWVIYHDKIPDKWAIELADIKFTMQQTDFGHLGIFAEQATNWRKIKQLVSGGVKHKEAYKVLNLFAYTGGSTLAAAQAGAQVVHLDASKTSVAWARENAEINGLQSQPIRWIVDDVRKFVTREKKRDSRYDAIILDPPSFGRGVKGELWKIEEHLSELLSDLKALCSEDFGFLLLSAHSPGFTPVALENLIHSCFASFDGVVVSEEMIITAQSGRHLPSGATALWTPKEISL